MRIFVGGWILTKSKPVSRSISVSKPISRSVEFCHFDGFPCSHVESCDDVAAVLFGEVPKFVCSRAVVGLRGSSYF